MIYAFGPYELDTRKLELREAGSTRPVEPQVFEVLAYLVANRDRVVTKDELLEKVWQDRFVSETTLTSRLKEARKAVGDTGKAQLVIRTHHGRGYRFVADVRVVQASRLPAGGGEERRQAGGPHYTGFVGRTSELARLHDALAAATNGHRRLVFVAGEAGAGKTTLVDTFLAGATVLVARGQCVEHRGTGEPYMPLLDAIGRLCRDPRASHAIDLLSREAPSWLLQLPWLVSDAELAALTARTGAAGERMLRELGMLIERLAGETPLVLLLEDLHWSDFATLEAIDLLARRTDPARLLLLGTFRPADVKAAKHPVYAVSHELRVRSLCELIDLPPLATREVDEYLRFRFPDAAYTGELAALLQRRTSGNALFVRNLVDSWIARGMIDAPLQTLETDVPDSLQQLIEKQIADFDAGDQRMLETASVVGREFPIAVVAATLAKEDDALEQRCETLAREGRFLRASGTEQWGDGTFTSRFAFTHDLHVDVLYDRIPAARRARLHQQAGLALERAWHGRERERAAELALHFQRAHDRDRAIRYLELAAEQATLRSAYREAVLHLNAQLELLREGPQNERKILDVRARLAPALNATRGWGDREAEENYLRAAELAKKLGDGARLSEVMYGMAVMYEYRGDYRKAERLTNERLQLDQHAAPINAVQSHELLSCATLHQGRYREAMEHGERALAAAAGIAGTLEPADVSVIVHAHGWLSAAYVFAGRAADAVRHGEYARQLAESKGDELAMASALVQAAFVRFYHGERKECRALAEAGSRIAAERRFPFHVACARILLGWCLSHDGRHEEAQREIRAGIKTSNAIGARLEMPLFLAMLSECLARAGEQAEALDTIDEALAMVNRNRSFFYLPEIYRFLGDLHLRRGDRETATVAFKRALALAEEQQSPYLVSRAERSLTAV